MPTVIDTLFVSLKLKQDNYASDSRKAGKETDKLKNSFNDLEKKTDLASKALKENAEKQKKAAEQAEKFRTSVNNGVKALASLFAMVMGSVGLGKLVSDTSKANDELNFLSKRLGMSARAVSNWQGAADMAGGSAQGMATSMTSLHQSMVSMVTTGDTSILPFLNGMGVSVTDVNGSLRSMDKVFLDLSSSLSKMDRGSAFMFGHGLGLDDGTINVLVQGRKEVERQLELQKKVAVSSEKELALSRKFNELRALAMKQIDGIKNTLSNFLMPYFIKMLNKVESFITLLSNNKEKTINFFKGLAAIISVVLIPVFIRAAWSAVVLFASVALIPALVALVATAILGLIEDYDKWKKGAKSLIDWSKWSKQIERAKKAFKGLWDSLDKLARKIFELFHIDFSKFSIDDLANNIIAGVAKATEALGRLVNAMGKVLDGDFKGALAELGKSDTDDRDSYANATVDAGFRFFGGNTDQDRQAEEIEAKRKITFWETKNSSIATADQKQIDRWATIRGVRNNNPINLGYFKGLKNARLEDVSKDGTQRFAKFDTPDDGIRAAAHQYMLYYTGKSKNTDRPLKSIADIIPVASPKADKNNETAYINALANKLKKYPHDDLQLDNPENMANYIKAVSEVENEGFSYTKLQIGNALQGRNNNWGKWSKNNRSWLDKSLINQAFNPMSFIDQTQKLQTQQQKPNNYVTANFGDINIKTSASTVSGNVADATESATSRMFQLIPSLR